MSEKELIIRLLVAALFGALVGLERELQGHPAGLRTHLLVCLGSALILVTNIKLFEQYNNQTTMDVTRMGAQVVSGIGFLGAGTIIRASDRIRGLTTAATLWSVAAIGLAVGSGLYLAGGVTTVIVVVALTLFRPMVDKIAAQRNKNSDDHL
ncbi:MAG: putative Mg2+ transporter-C (MgtC) family protein [Candidatus Omnitrophota bacterium]|jgi:putative Mg2+ transporter-C (MgtC) family protein